MIAALQQSWPPFVLVSGLVLIGLVADRDGLFEAAAGALTSLPGASLALFAACCATVTITTALLNLDTAAVFLTPVLLLAARRRGVPQAPFLYGALFMVNASSLYLPGSNLTNLLVGAGGSGSGVAFLARMLPIALAATVATAVGVALLHRGALATAPSSPARAPGGAAATAPRGSLEPASPGEGGHAPLGVGLLAVAAAAALILTLRNAAIPVLLVGVAAIAVRALQGRLTLAQAAQRLGVPSLLALFLLTVGLGALARTSGFPGHDLSSAGAPLTAAVGALSSVAINNLPAAALLSAAPVAHPAALLVGLDVGPNLAVSGSLSALLWWRAAKASGAQPSAVECTREGLLLAPLAIAAALAAGAAAGVLR